MKKIIFLTLLFLLLSSCILQAAPVPTVYINNKPFIGKIFVYKDIVYLEASSLLNSLNIANSTTDTVLSIKDAAIQTKLAKIAVWVDYQDGRGNVISFPLRNLADAIGGRYTYYPDTNTVDMVSFARKPEQQTVQSQQKPTQTQQTTSNTGNTNTTNTGGTTSSYSGNNNSVNLFNTTKILTDAQNAVNGAQNK